MKDSPRPGSNMTAWRCLFAVGLLFTLLFYSVIFGLLPGKHILASIAAGSASNSQPAHDYGLQISTNLNDLSPDYLADADARYAAEQLAKDIEKRLLLLVRGDKSAVSAAQAAIESTIQRTANIDLSPIFSEFAPNIMASLAPYRFQLLSPAQHAMLRSVSTATSTTPTAELSESIANKAYAELYQLDANLRVTRFDQDPLAWFNDYLLSTIQRGLSQQKTTTQSDNSEQTPQASSQQTQQIISLNIASGAMEMATQAVLAAQLDALLNNIQQEFSVEVLRSGIFFFASEAAQSSKSDISLITSISMLGVLIVLLLAFRSLWPLVLPFTSIALGVAFAAAVTHVLYLSLIHI